MTIEGRVAMRKFREFKPNEIITPAQYYLDRYSSFNIALRDSPELMRGFDEIYLTYPVTSSGILFDDQKSTFSPKKPKWEWMQIINGRTMDIIYTYLKEEIEMRLPPNARRWEILVLQK